MSADGGRVVLDSILHKLPSSRKYYRVTLLVPDNGIPIIEYRQANSTKKPKKCIQFVDLLFADKKHDTNDKFAFSVYTTENTITFLAQDETTMNEWLNKIKECHSNLYPEFKSYDAVFEANLLDRGLAKTMNITGPYRLALCKDSLDLIPVLTALGTAVSGKSSKKNKHQEQPSQPVQVANIISPQATTTTSTTDQQPQSLVITSNTNPHLPQHLPSHQRFHKRHPLLSSKTIELVLRSIRRCGHTDSNFYIESGRHSQVGQGDLWMALNKKSTARHLHELLLATMKLASTSEDQFLCRAPRSRSGSSTATIPSSIPIFATQNNIDEDSGYLPMA